MPIPTPKPNETEDTFIHRCMTDQTMQDDYENNMQRYAVCVTQWSKKGNKDE